MRLPQVGVLAVALWLGSSAVALGQQTGVQTAQASSILQNSLKALDGPSVINDVTVSSTARRIAGSDDETGTAALKATVVGDSRVDLTLPSGNWSEIRNPSAIPLPGVVTADVTDPAVLAPQPVGEWLGRDGVAHGMASQNVMTDAAWFFPAATLTRILSVGSYSFSYIGEETVNGESVVHIQVSQPIPAAQKPSQRTAAIVQHLTQMDFYLDATTLLPVTLSFSAHPDDNAIRDIPTQIRFSDYRAVNGMQVPFRVQKYLNNSLVLDLQFNNVVLNSGISADTFAMQ